jgi:hypothetical protein
VLLLANCALLDAISPLEARASVTWLTMVLTQQLVPPRRLIVLPEPTAATVLSRKAAALAPSALLASSPGRVTRSAPIAQLAPTMRILASQPALTVLLATLPSRVLPRAHSALPASTPPTRTAASAVPVGTTNPLLARPSASLVSLVLPCTSTILRTQAVLVPPNAVYAALDITNL